MPLDLISISDCRGAFDKFRLSSHSAFSILIRVCGRMFASEDGVNPDKKR
jgi:hypothetical protein